MGRTIENIVIAPSGGAPDDDDCVKMDVFKEHKDGDAKTLSTILAALDQNGRIVNAAAVDVSDKVTEMREDNKLVRLALDGHRQEIDQKIGELHDKINSTTQLVATMKGSNDQIVEIAKEFIKLKTGTTS